jgi:signal transduction histidine kinase
VKWSVRPREHEPDRSRVRQSGRTTSATLSHELRTPQCHHGWVSLLRHQRLDEAQLGHAIEVIGRNTKMQAQLVNDLSDVSRIGRKLSMDMEEVDLDDWFGDYLRAEGVRPGKSQITTRPIRRELGAGDVRLQQVIEFCRTRSSSPRRRAHRCGAERRDSQARFVIRDTGCIDARHGPHFRRFEQERGARTGVARTGSRLAISRYVDAHGGDIRAESQGGRGGVHGGSSVLSVRTGTNGTTGRAG